MGICILHDEERAVAALTCGTADWAFGPVFHGLDGRSAEDRAEAFVRYVNAHPENNPISGLFGKFDIRHLSEEQLERAYSNWLAQEAQQFDAEARAAAEELAALRGEDEAADALCEQREYDEARLHPERFR